LINYPDEPVKKFLLISTSCHPAHEEDRAESRTAAGAAHLTRATGAVALATLLSRILGFARDAAIAWYFGAGFSSDAFLAAFRIPNLFRRLVAEGTLTSAFVPVLTEVRWKGGDAEAGVLFSSAVRALAGLLLAACAAGLLAAPWIVPALTPGFPEPKLELTLTLVRLMLPYLITGGLVALFMGALNVYGRFAVPALAPSLLNVAMIGALLAVAPFLDRPVLALALGLLIGGAAQLAVQMPLLRRCGLHPWRAARRGHPAMARMARFMVPAVVGGAAYHINILVGTMLASLLPEGSVSYLYYADRLVEFPLGVAAMAAATVVLPSLARDAAAGDMPALRTTFEYALRLVSFVTIPAAVGLVLLAEPIVFLLFARGEFSVADARLTVLAVSYYALGLWAFSAVRIVAATFFALQDSKTPVRAALVSILANLALGIALMRPLAHGGMALATSLAAVLNLVLLVAALRRKLGGMDERALARCLVRSLFSAGLMAPAVLGVARLTIHGTGQSGAGLALGLAASMATGAVIYFCASLVFGSPEVRMLLSAMRKKGRVR
jgi:putative peptidoglycan lipid II flippase